MNNTRKIIFSIFTAFLLTACNTGGEAAPSSSVISVPSTTSSEPEPESKMVEKKVNVYRLFNRDNDYLDPDLSEKQYQLGTVTFNFVKGQEFIPYITLEEASELYSQFFIDKDNTQSIVVEVENEHTWTIDKNGQEVFKSLIDTEEKTFYCSGNLGRVVESKKDYSKYSIGFRSKTEESVVTLGDERDYMTSYQDTEFEIIEENNETYFPFSMLHTFYHEFLGHDFFYNYTYLYEYNNVDDISKATITDGSEIYTPLEQMTRYVEDHVKEKDSSGNRPLMPLYLRKYHRSEFTLVMNNYYGLANTWGVEKMTDLFSIYGIYDRMIDESADVRGAAYSEAFFMLSDNHTGRTILGDNPWIEKNGNGDDIRGGERTPFSVERNLVSSALTEQRDRFLKANGFEDGIKDALIYSKDGTTAYFSFDSFDATSNGYKSDGVTPKSDEQLASQDSYFYFVKMFKQIVAHNENSEVKVKNVIIDDSLNGGGYIGILGKLLALLSKNNSATITTLNDISNICCKNVYHVDTNNDGKYDEKDVYGNMFNFFILTSPISFSCGNAFPILAQKQFSHVKIIGVKSGGGECVVGDNYFSNGMGFAHSSNEHLIVLDEEKKTYDGVEAGVSVDSTMKYCDFYDMEAMIKAINAIRN